MSRGSGEHAEQVANAAVVRAGISGLGGGLGALDVAGMGDPDRIRLLAELTELAAVVGAAQARLTVAYADSQRSLGATLHGIAAEVGMARRTGLSRARDFVARSRILVEDLPETMAQMAAGALGEERAHIVADRLSGVDAVTRELVDGMVADDLARLSDREVRDCVDRAVHGVDAEEVARRRARTHARRHVTVRALGDGMADLVVRCSLVDAASAFATLGQHSDAMVAVGRRDSDDDPTREQVMADCAVAWLTGRERYEGPPVEVQLVMPASGMFADPTTGRHDDSPAELLGIGPLPAAAARELIGRDARTRSDPALGTDARAMARLVDREATRVTVRRVWTTPDGRDLVGIETGRWVLPMEVRLALRTSMARADDGPPARPWDWLGQLSRPPGPGELVDLESGERCYRGLLRSFVMLRDQLCRAPWCGARIRHIDHVKPYREVQETSAAGGLGACVGHNLAKESPGHRVVVEPRDDAHPSHTITWQTPSGQRHHSTAPPVLGWGTSARSASVPEATADPAVTSGSVFQPASPLEEHLQALLVA